MALQAAVLLADQPAGGAVVIHHAGGVAVDAHLLFDRAAARRRCARRASRRRSTSELRHHEQRDALGARGRAFDARQHQVDDVLGQVVLAGGDEDLGAGDLVAAVGLLAPPWCATGRDRCRNAARSGSSCRSTRRSTIFGRYFAFSSGEACAMQRGDGALRQARIHGEGHVGRAEEFVDRMAVSVAGRPWPPNSAGAEMPIQPPSTSCSIGVLEAGWAW